MATVKHSDKFKVADLVKHNETLHKQAEVWKRFDPSYPDAVEDTVESIQKKPGFYIKDSHKGFTEWRGPFNTEQEAKDWHAEMAWERKHG